MTLVSKNIFWLTISRTAALVLLFFAYTRLFRYLGPHAYGQYQFILSYILLFSTIVDFGIQQFITKHISERPDQAKKYFHSFLAFEGLAAILLYAILAAIALGSHYDRSVTAGILIAGLGMAANALTYPFLAVLSSAQDLRKVALVNFLNSLVNIAVIFLAVFFHRSIVFLSCIQLVFGLMDLALYRIFIRKHLPRPDIFMAFRDFDFGIIKRILFSAWPFALLVGFSAIYNRIDVVIITQLLGYEQTGYYGAAYKVYDLLSFFPATVSFTLFPHFTSLMARMAILEVRMDLEKYIRLMLAVALPMAVGGSVLSRGLIALVAGPEFVPAAKVLAVLIWAPAIQFIYIPVNSLIISQLTKKAMIVTGANVLVNVAGNLILVPRYGILAAASMTVISETIQGIFYFYFVKKTITDFSLFRWVWQPFLAAGIMGAVLLWLRGLPILFLLPAGAAVYGAALLASGFVKKNDFVFFKNLFGNRV